MPASASPTVFLDLAIVVPVYNEEELIVGVLEEWRATISKHVARFLFIVIDDGSRDQTPQKLEKLDWPELRVHRHENRGHGQSCLVGYQIAADAGAHYVFQIDSDGQCDPSAFSCIWEKRGQAPAIYGRRTHRADGLARSIISRVLRLLLRLTQRTRLNDANVPFRLYQSDAAAAAAKKVPRTFDLANIAIALVLEPLGFIEVPINFRDRSGGHPSVRWLGFAKKALRLRRDLRELHHA
jgi:dolichol-phosphate mannosyltransferase